MKEMNWFRRTFYNLRSAAISTNFIHFTVIINVKVKAMDNFFFFFLQLMISHDDLGKVSNPREEFSMLSNGS